jgi:hypothetical protein
MLLLLHSLCQVVELIKKMTDPEKGILSLYPSLLYRMSWFCIFLTRRGTTLTTGIPCKDRKWLLHTYKNCFVGREAVDWFIANHYAATREEAVELGNLLLKNFIFRHVTKGTFLTKMTKSIHQFCSIFTYFRVTNKPTNKQTKQTILIWWLDLICCRPHLQR